MWLCTVRLPARGATTAEAESPATINRDMDWPRENTALVEAPAEMLLETAWSLENAAVADMEAAISRYLVTRRPMETARDTPAEMETYRRTTGVRLKAAARVMVDEIETRAARDTKMEGERETPVAICRSLEDIRPMTAAHEAAAEIEMKWDESIDAAAARDKPVEMDRKCAAEYATAAHFMLCVGN